MRDLHRFSLLPVNNYPLYFFRGIFRSLFSVLSSSGFARCPSISAAFAAATIFCKASAVIARIGTSRASSRPTRVFFRRRIAVHYRHLDIHQEPYHRVPSADPANTLTPSSPSQAMSTSLPRPSKINGDLLVQQVILNQQEPFPGKVPLRAALRFPARRPFHPTTYFRVHCTAWMRNGLCQKRLPPTSCASFFDIAPIIR